MITFWNEVETQRDDSRENVKNKSLIGKSFSGM